MKKLFFILIFFVLCGNFIFGDNDAQEEIDFLLFLPDSGNRFVFPQQANTQLDNLARFILGKDLIHGQIIVYGYAAVSQNNVDEMELSKNRALHVINELQNRGVSKDLFSDPIGYGSVDLWGTNVRESDKAPNRRVRILLDGTLVTAATLETAETEIKPPPAPVREVVIVDEPKSESRRAFPWWIFLPLLGLILLIFLLARRRKRSSPAAEPVKTAPPVSPPIMPLPVSAPVAADKAVPIVAPIVVPVVPRREVLVDLEDEIRFRAYELFLERHGINGDAEGDWHAAVCQICAKYEADGYQTGFVNWRWQASKWV